MAPAHHPVLCGLCQCGLSVRTKVERHVHIVCRKVKHDCFGGFMPVKFRRDPRPVVLLHQVRAECTVLPHRIRWSFELFVRDGGFCLLLAFWFRCLIVLVFLLVVSVVRVFGRREARSS